MRTKVPQWMRYIELAIEVLHHVREVHSGIRGYHTHSLHRDEKIGDNKKLVYDIKVLYNGKVIETTRINHGFKAPLKIMYYTLKNKILEKKPDCPF